MKDLCFVPDCPRYGRTPVAQPFCMQHWRQVPEDLRTRLLWSLEQDDDTDYEAAINAILEVIEDEGL